jgi:hypothetical protein
MRTGAHGDRGTWGQGTWGQGRMGKGTHGDSARRDRAHGDRGTWGQGTWGQGTQGRPNAQRKATKEQQEQGRSERLERNFHNRLLGTRDHTGIQRRKGVCSGNFELRLTSARVIISREPRRRDLVEAAVCVGRWVRSSTAGDLVAATPLMTHTRNQQAKHKASGDWCSCCWDSYGSAMCRACTCGGRCVGVEGVA